MVRRFGFPQDSQLFDGNYDIEGLMDNRERLVEKISRSQEQTLEPLERHRLTAFYEDGGEHMKGAMQLREILARQRKEIQAMVHAASNPIGDQFMEVATIPAFIQQPWGIAGDQEDLLQLLDEEAPVIAAEEEERVDTMIEEELQPGSDIYDDEVETGPEIESDIDETDEAL